MVHKPQRGMFVVTLTAVDILKINRLRRIPEPELMVLQRTSLCAGSAPVSLIGHTGKERIV